LGSGLWSNAVTFETLTAAPEITIQVDNTTGVTSQSIYVEWKVCFVKNNEKCGEDILSNQGDLRCFRLFVYHRP